MNVHKRMETMGVRITSRPTAFSSDAVGSIPSFEEAQAERKSWVVGFTNPVVSSPNPATSSPTPLSSLSFTTTRSVSASLDQGTIEMLKRQMSEASDVQRPSSMRHTDSSSSLDVQDHLRSRSQPQLQRSRFIQRLTSTHSMEIESIKQSLSVPFLSSHHRMNARR